ERSNPVEHARIDGTGADAVDADILLSILQGGRLRKADDPEFARHVCGTRGMARQPRDGRGVDDRTVALFQKLPDLVLHAEKHPLQVDAELYVPIFVRIL